MKTQGSSTRIFVYLPLGHSRKIFSKNTFSVEQVALGYLSSSAVLGFRKALEQDAFPLRLVSFADWKISEHGRDLISYIIISYVMFFSHANFQR